MMKLAVLLSGVAVLCLCCIVAADPTSAHAARRQLLKKDKAGSSPVAEGAAAAAQCCARLPAGFSSNLPVVVVTTQSVPVKGIPHPQTGKRAPASVCTCNSTVAGTDLEVGASINERGSHSEDTNVIRSYELTLDSPGHYLGFPRGTKFVHYGPQNDTMGLHYWLALQLYRGTGETWVPRTQFIELFVTDGDRPISYPADYLGLYMAAEHIARGKNRLPIKKATDADVTGGYILDNEHGKQRAGKNQTQFTLKASGITYIIREPKAKALTPSMVAYIKGYLDDFESALNGPGFAGPEGFRKFVNETSMIDYLLTEELSKNNNDGYRGSQFLWKDAGKPLNFGPAWGLDDGFGTCCGFPVEGYNSLNTSAIQPEGWMFDTCSVPARCKIDPVMGVSVWYRRAWQDPAFRRAVAQREQQLRAGPWSDAQVVFDLEGAVGYVHDAAVRTLTKWGKVDACPRQVCQDWASPQAEIDAVLSFIKQWTLARLHWFDTALAPELGAAAAAPGGGAISPAG